MYIRLQFLTNKVEKIKLDNNQESDCLMDKNIILSEIISENRIFNGLIISLIEGNYEVDKKYISSRNLDISLYLEIAAYYRGNIFNRWIDFKTKKYSYRFILEEEKTKNNHIVYLSKLIVKKRNKNKFLIARM